MTKSTKYTRISSGFTAGDWENLKRELVITDDWNPAWEECTRMLTDRVSERFFGPIEVILAADIQKKEGFTMATILCMLVEFFSALYQGKVYNPRSLAENECLELFEYNSSSGIMKEFLTRQPPFNDYFDTRLAYNFFYEVRCALLHEARTKGVWKIKETNGEALIDADKHILYRTTFYQALRQWFENYKALLRGSPDLRRNLIRKIDDIVDN